MAKNKNKNNFSKPEPVVEEVLTAVDEIVTEVPTVEKTESFVVPEANLMSHAPIITEDDDDDIRQSTQSEIVRARQALVSLSDYVEYGGIDPMSCEVLPSPGGGSTVKPEPLFGGFYKVTNLSKNGQTFLPGLNYRIPCSRVHLNLKQVEQLAMDGYTMQLLDEPTISAGYSKITKKNVHAFILKVKNMIEYGFITVR